MNITIRGRKINLRDSFKERTEKKLKKFDRFFDSGADAIVTASLERDRFTVEVTIKSQGMIYRSEKTTADLMNSLDTVTDALFQQIVKNKSKLEAKLRDDAFAEPDESYLYDYDESAAEYHVVRNKRFVVNPMSVEEAILQMNMLGHEFFMFRNGATDEICVVYRRKDDNYGLLEPNAE
ncbi:MAG: ribosome hibernation-promoting factor, HPF/YfiA family [Acetanaerobacterium sp.]